MMPDHARALRTSAALAMLAGPPAFFLTVAHGHRGEWLAFGAMLFITLALAAIGARCAYAFDQFQARRRSGRGIAAMALLGCALASYPAAAQQRAPETLARAGAWSAFVAMGNRGTPICGMDANGDGGRHFMVKRIGQDQHLVVHIARETWSIPIGTRVRATFAIGGRSWSGTGTATQASLIEWTLSGPVMDEFMAAFQAGLELRVAFHAGNEAPWRLSLIGTSAMTNAFLGCIRAQNGVMQAPQAPTQPFSSSDTPPPAATGRERRT